MSDQKTRSGRKLRLLPMLAAGAMLIAVVAYLVGQSNAMPVVRIPTPVMPNPNAFDDNVAAGQAMVDSKKVAAAIAATHHPDPSYLEQRAYSPAEQAVLLRENARALAKVREGFRYPYLAPPVRSFFTLFPYAGPFRDLARLFVLEGQVEAGRGDWAGAVNSDLDAIQFGGRCWHGGTMMGPLIGVSCEQIGRQHLWGAIAHLNARQACDAAGRMNTILADNTRLADVVQEEKWSTQAGLMEIFRSSGWRASLASAMGGSAGPSGRVNEIPLLFMSKREIMDSYTREIDRYIAYARAPYAAKAPPPALPKGLVNASLVPAMTGLRLRIVVSQTQNALIAATLGLRAYQAGHGAYPPTLADLVPKYLPAIPDDPFALKGPLLYKKTGSSYVVYSVGPDGKDDGGTAIVNMRRKGSIRHMVEDTSAGDIVAGINLF